MIVRVPASSANLGPGFDALGMALDLHAEVGLLDGEPPAGAQAVDEHHPATKAFRAGGGRGALWVRCSIPVGRGMGFSGAVRVGGLVAASAQRLGVESLRAESAEILRMATELEGHADNVAASLYGGVVATAAGMAVHVPLGFDPAVVVWVPSFTTSTDDSRHKLSSTVTFDDAVFNVGRTALLVAALAGGDVHALRAATEDRLHQAARLARAAPSRDALQAGLDAGAWCGWLSGSGPTITLLCAPDLVDTVIAGLPDDGRSRHMRIDHAGAVVEGS
jgi:homoserine kinase